MSDLRKLLDEATPGSWEITGRKITKHGGTYDFISGFKWGKFARVVVRFDYDYADNPAGVANARLIAAAPDLLQCVVDAIPHGISTDNKNISDSQIIPVDMTMGELRRMKAAFNKATGAPQ